MNTVFNQPAQDYALPLPKLKRPAGVALEANKDLKNAIWLYLMLLLFEGALRKWFLPGLATPLLVVRDPIAIYIVFVALSRGLLAFNAYVVSIVSIGVIGIACAMAFGHANLTVAFYGARPFLFNFPMMYVMAAVLTKEDVIKLGKAIVIISIPMTMLVILQFYSPQSAWVNRGVGGNMDGAGFIGSGDYYRPPATFSFTNGTALFYSLTTCFLLYFWLNKHLSKGLVIAATIALMIAVPLSISRALFFQVVIALIFVFLALSRKPQLFWKIFFATILAVAGFILLSKTSFFSTGTSAFMDRFTSANEEEGGLNNVFYERYVGTLESAIVGAPISTPLFGYGIGKGTNVGAMLLTGSADVFLISEGEWGRLIGELGPLLGILIVLLRFVFAIKIGWASYKRLSVGDILPWMLASYAILSMVQDSWSQPTALGFYTVTGGLILASFKPIARRKTASKLRKESLAMSI